MRAWFACALLIGCARDPLAISEWRLRAEGRDFGEVTLPAELGWRLEGARRFHLEAEVALPPELRGRPLSFGAAFIPSSARVLVDGREAYPLDEILARAYTRGWHLPARDAPSLRIEIEGDAGTWLGSYFGAAPSLSGEEGGPPSYRRALFFNAVCPLVAVVALAVLSLVGIYRWLLDRKRTAFGWFALMAIAIVPAELTTLGLLEPLFGFTSAQVTLVMASMAGVFSLFLVHASFRLRPPTALVGVLPVLPISVVMIAERRWWLAAVLVPDAICLALGIRALVRVVRRPRLAAQRLSAGLLLGAWLFLLAAVGIDSLLAAARVEWLGGVVGDPIGLIVFAMTCALVLGREQVLQSRRAEQLTVELRHQIVERSSQLAQALAQIGSVDAAAEKLGPGAILDGRYRIERALGQGGMGHVFECVRISDERRFAVKLLAGAPGPSLLARFAREAQIAAALDHPNLVAVRDVAMTGDAVLYLVMDLVEGRSLEDERPRFGDTAWALPVLHQIALGLAAMHASGIVHRDLKPANVLLGSDGIIKITDFGIAALAPAEDEATIKMGSSADLTRTGFVMGTPDYMAPELAHGARGALASSDIFSFGVLAYELLAGSEPYAASPALSVREGRAVEPHTPLGERSDADAQVIAAVERCLSFAPETRPSAEELARLFGGRA